MMALNQENRAKKHLRLRRAKTALGHARKVYVKTREQAKRAADTAEESTEEYAAEQTRQLLEDALRDSTEAVGGGTRAALRRGRQLYGKRKAVEEKESPEVPQSQEERPMSMLPPDPGMFWQGIGERLETTPRHQPLEEQEGREGQTHSP